MKQRINNIFLNASAGSGKTFALCVRYIALLFQNVQAHEILTLTFTKKAANEMKERITQNLFILYVTTNHDMEKLYSSDDKHYKDMLEIKNNILKALNEYDIDDECVEKNIAKVYRHFLQSDNKIGTIDSFFNTILRKFAFFIGIRRDFQLQEKGLDEQIFENFLKIAYKDSNLNKILNSLTRDLKLQVDATFNNTLNLKRLLSTLYDKSIEFTTKDGFTKAMQPAYTLKRAREFAEMLAKEEIKDIKIMESVSKNLDLNHKKNTQEIEKNGAYHSILSHLDSIIQEKKLQPNIEYVARHISQTAWELGDFLQSIALQDCENGDKKGGKNRIKQLCDKLQSGDIGIILTNTLVIKKEHNHVKQDLKPDKTMESEIARFCTKIQNIGTLYFMCYESALLSHIYLLMGVYVQIAQELESQQNALSFQSIAHKVFAITTDTLHGDTKFQSDYFYFRLDSAISHILFDEYQDTSAIQYRIFSPIFQEILSGSGTKDSKGLFFVGDSKQSLYAFRGANLHVFEATKKTESMQQQSLQHNYRSEKAVIDFVNDKFSQIYKKDYLPQLYGGNTQEGGVVSVRLYGDLETKNNEQEVMRDVFTNALKQIDELAKTSIPKKEIAILARKRETLQNFVLFAKEQKSKLLFNLDKNGKLINQHSIQAIFYAFKTKQYKNKIKTLESSIEKLQNQTQKQETNIHKTQTKNEQKQENLNTEHENADIKAIQKDLLKTRNNLKLAQKKLNKLLGKSYFDNQNIYIPTKQSLAQSIKSVMESCQLYNQDCMELLEFASENIQVKTIDELFELLDNQDSIVMQDEAISAMSVHASKGLGFQYVIYLDYEGQNNANADLIFYDYRDIFLNQIRVNTTKSNTKLYIDKTLKELMEQKILDDIKQEYNNLYVACTRAKNGLYIFANMQSSIAKTLNLQTQEDYGKFQQKMQQTQTSKNNQIIISNLKVAKSKQEEFLQKEKSIYHHNISMQHKQIIGIGLHYCLELMLGYDIQKPDSMMQAMYGFYLNDNCIVEILQKAKNIYSPKLKKLLYLDKNMIKCEVSFLQENSIKRLDAIVQRDDGFSIIEFKSSQNISEALLQSHTAQLQSYMECIATIFQYTKQISGYLVYLQDNIAVKEIKLCTTKVT